MLIVSFALMLAAAIACLLIWKRQGKQGDKIQLMMFAVLCANMVLFWAQIKVFTDDSILRQRPFLSTEVETEITGTGDKINFQDLNERNEVRVITRIENDGLSPAIIESIEGRAFYAFFTKAMGEDKPELQFSVLGGKAEDEVKVHLNSQEDFPVKMQPLCSDVHLMPHRTLRYPFLINAVTWKERFFTSFKDPAEKLSIPIIIQTKLRYRDIQGNPYHQNIVFSVKWHKSNTVSPSVNILQSIDKAQKLIVPTKDYIQLVSGMQGVDPESIRNKRLLELVGPKPLEFRSGVQIESSPPMTYK